MPSVVRVRLTWDDTILEERIVRRRLRIGAGERAQLATPGARDRYVTLHLRGQALALTVEPGAAARVILPGEPPIDVGTQRFQRVLQPPYGSGRLVIVCDGRETFVDFERVTTPAPPRDRALLVYAAAALVLAMLGASSVRLLRRFGDDDRHERDQPLRLSEREAMRVRVRLGPDGAGASRPQAGSGRALRGDRLGQAVEVASVLRPPAPTASSPRPRATNLSSVKRAGRGATAARRVSAEAKTSTDRRSRAQLLDDAQAALLAADLRRAIESYSTAKKTAPLDYDQLNWLGLAHYLSGDYDAAEQAWSEARRLDGARVDAINNLASVAKRRGDTARELALLDEALAQSPGDCHASNSLALALAKSGQPKAALDELQQSDASCGGEYAYTFIQRAALLALAGDGDAAMKQLEQGLQRVDTLVPVKEFEVMTDLERDPAFASLRGRPELARLEARYLPRAATWRAGGGRR